MGGGGSKRPVSCMMVRGDTRKVREDNEVSVVLDDGGGAKIRCSSVELL